jgi:hypothetical protein
MKNETIIELKVGYESEYADSGISTIRLTLNKTLIKKLQRAIKHCSMYHYFCIKMFCPSLPLYFNEEGEEIINSESNFRIGSEYFKVFSKGICFTAESKYDGSLYIEAEEFTIDDDLNVSKFGDIIGSQSE